MAPSVHEGPVMQSEMAVAGVAASLGLVLRQMLGRRRFALLTLPLSAA